MACHCPKVLGQLSKFLQIEDKHLMHQPLNHTNGISQALNELDPNLNYSKYAKPHFFLVIKIKGKMINFQESEVETF